MMDYNNIFLFKYYKILFKSSVFRIYLKNNEKNIFIIEEIGKTIKTRFYKSKRQDKRIL